MGLQVLASVVSVRRGEVWSVMRRGEVWMGREDLNDLDPFESLG